MRNAEQIILELQSNGIKLWAEDGKLRYRAPKGAFTATLRSEVKKHKTQILSLLNQSVTQSVRHEEIQPVSRANVLPLSFAQQRLWFLDQLGSSIAYNMPGALNLRGPLNVAALRSSLQEIVQRHESLRTTFAVDEGTPYQVIHSQMTSLLPVINLSAVAAQEQALEIKRLTAAEATRPFDLSRDAMLRATLLRLNAPNRMDTQHILLLTLHHIASDGWSLGVLVRELAALYEAFSQARPSPLPDLRIQYADFAVWQRSYLQGEVLEQQLSYWKKRLAGAPPLLQLPTDRPRPAQQSFRGDAVQVTIEADLTSRLRRLSQKQGATLYMTLLAAFQILMSRYTGQTDVVIGSPIANRNRQEIEPLIGFFVNTLAMRADLSGGDGHPLTVLELLAQVKETTEAAYDHQDLPFERLVEELQLERNINYNTLVQLFFGLQNAPMDPFHLPGLTVTQASSGVQTTRFDLEMHLWEVDSQLQGYCIYSTDLFDKQTIQRMMGHFQTLLAGIVADPQRSIAELPLLTEAERHQILIEWNDTATDYPNAARKSIHQLFEEQTERTPNAMAVLFDGANSRSGDGPIGSINGQFPQLPSQSLTYRELNQRANQLAHYLISLGVGPETLVGICIPRSTLMVVGLLGILKAGGAYVPLDPTYPQERLAFMLEDADISLLLTQQHLRERLPSSTVAGLGAGTRTRTVVCLDSDWSQIANHSHHNLTRHACVASQVKGQNLAYVLYTSGSTGQPKGVMIEHRQVLAMLSAYEQLAPHNKQLCGTSVCSYNFDVSVWEFFSILCFGGTLHILTIETYSSAEKMVNYLCTHAITSAYLPPMLLTEIALTYERSQTPITLKRILVGVEPIPQRVLQRFRNLSPSLSIINGYGPTECTICSSFYEFSHAVEPEQRTPIGKPLPNYQIYLCDANLQPVPIGVSGQILIGGAGVGRRYLNRPELTEDAFIVNPFAPKGAAHGAGRLYKTGDLARWLPDGNIEFLGRIDHQVKLRGFRIELGEIETTLTQHPAIEQAVVSFVESPGNKQLVGYLVAGSVPETEDVQQWPSLYEETYGQSSGSELSFNLTGEPISEEEMARAWRDDTNNPLNRTLVRQVRKMLQKTLPDYMIPSAFVLLDALPLTPNGKVDRKALPAPLSLVRFDEESFVPPSTPTEIALANIWSEVLGIERIGIQDNFFELGGHSLLATQVIAKIRQAFSVDLGLRTLFATPTIAANAQALRLQGSKLKRTQQQQTEERVVQAFPEIVHASGQRYEPFPLTDVQHAYWVGRRAGFELGNISAHIYFELDSSTLDVERLNQAWQVLTRRHEMLRAIIQPDGQQRILASVPDYEFVFTDLTNMDEASVEPSLEAIRDEMSHQVLPSEQWPLFDIRVTRMKPTVLRLHMSLDGLIMDGTSMGILFREWLMLYQNPQALLPPLEVSFRDYVLAEKAFALSATYQQAWAYWEKRLDSLPPAPQLPLRQDGQTIVQPRFDVHTFQLDATRWKSLKRYGHRAGLTDSTIILSAFAEILTQWSKQAHFTLNLTLFNRLPFDPQINEIVGDFTPLLMLEVDNRANGESFQIRAQRIQQQLWDNLDHSIVNGVRVLRELAKRQGSGVNRALMPVVFTSMLATEFDNTLFEPLGTLGYASNQTPQVWLDHGVTESAGALNISWSVVEELFPEGMIDDMFDAYCRLLQRLATDEEAFSRSSVRQHQSHLALIPQHQRQQREMVNATSAPISDEMLHTLFLQQVQAHATEPAVITPTKTLTYHELYHRAKQVGHWLRDQGAKANRLVAVVMEKGWEQVVAVLGIHLSGAAYLPIDPNLPTERLHYLLEQGETTIALTQSFVTTELEWPESIIRLAVDTLRADTTLPALNIVQTPTDLAYVIYTSGSTGLPKGVVIDHRGAVNTVLDVNRRYEITAKDRVLALSALNFDLSVYDIFGLLAVGGAIVMPDAQKRIDPEHWQELIHRHRVTVWNTVPALMQMLVDYAESGRVGEWERGRHASVASEGEWESERVGDSRDGRMGRQGALYAPSPPLRVVMMSGDWIPATLPDRIKALWEAVKVVSMGGATEASIWSIYYPIEEVDPAWPSIPYGKPMTNQTFHVLDANLNPRPVWVPGDLYIGGIGLALGYWKDEERTNASFITHPISPPTLGGTKGGRERLYKTGDLGRYLPDGNIEFLGREDFQVKIRGHRIELGEIESTLLQHPGINQAVVNAVGDPKGHRQLVGYVVFDETWRKSQDKTQKIMGQLPDLYDESHSVTLSDPIERLEFKLRQPGIRQLANTAPVALPTRAFDESRRKTWLARQSYRHFLDEVIALDTFSDFLSCLMQMPFENPQTPRGHRMPLPKYRYPSAGHLYPVQCYLYIKPARIAGLAGGYYYYQPAQHHLYPLQIDDAVVEFRAWGANQAIFSQSAFTLFLVADLHAIRPMYGEIARDFSLLEAGYISQLLMMEATQYELGLCPIGGVARSTLRQRLELADNHQLLHTLAGGRIDPAAEWLQSAPNVGADISTSAASWQKQLQLYLAQKLPNYMIPTTYVALGSLPLTANGKVNRRALPIPDVSMVQTTEFVPPRNDIEHSIAEIWCELLELPQVSIHDDFFALGGDSLIATQLKSRLRDKTQIDLPLRIFFEKNTIADLAKHIEANIAIHAMRLLNNTDEEEEIW